MQISCKLIIVLLKKAHLSTRPLITYHLFLTCGGMDLNHQQSFSVLNSQRGRPHVIAFVRLSVYQFRHHRVLPDTLPAAVKILLSFPHRMWLLVVFCFLFLFSLLYPIPHIVFLLQPEAVRLSRNFQVANLSG